MDVLVCVGVGMYVFLYSSDILYAESECLFPAGSGYQSRSLNLHDSSRGKQGYDSS